MVTQRRYVIDFTIINHDEDLIERLNRTLRDDMYKQVPAPAAEITKTFGAEKFVMRTVVADGHTRVAVPH